MIRWFSAIEKQPGWACNRLQRACACDCQCQVHERASVMQARARDMEVFVQVLLNYSDDPRELSELRASEARYRALADSLRSKLDGPEHQAKQEALRQREVLSYGPASYDTYCKSSDGQSTRSAGRL